MKFICPIQWLRPQTCLLNKSDSVVAFVSQGTSALRDTWPPGDWQERWQNQLRERRADEDSDHSDSDSQPTGVHNVSLGGPEMSHSEDAVTNSLSGSEPKRENPRAATQEADQNENESSKDLTGSLCLRSRALISLAEALVRGQKLDEDALSQAQMLPDFWPAVKAALYQNADSLKSTPNTLEMMYQSLKEERDVDAGPFITIPVPDLAIVLDRLSHGGQMQSLNLSGRSTLTKNELEHLIKHAGALQALYLMGAAASLSISDLTELQLPGDIYHHELLKRALRPRDSELAIFWEGRTVWSRKPQAEPDMLKFILGGHSVQHIAYVIVPVDDERAGKSKYWSTSGIRWSHLSAEGSSNRRHTYESLGDVMKCRKYPLTGTPMPLSRLVIGIRNLMEW